MLRLKNLTLMGLLGISLAAAEKIPIASWSFDQGSDGDEVRGFQKIVDGVMDRLLDKMAEVGYTGFSLGLPGDLMPVKKGDYVHENHPPERTGRSAMRAK